MRIYDITLTLSPDLVVWPGDPRVVLERRKKIEEGSHDNISGIEMSVHTGTHVDAPYHFIAEGEGAEKLSLKALTGRAYVLHLPDVDEITAAILERADIHLAPGCSCLRRVILKPGPECERVPKDFVGAARTVHNTWSNAGKAGRH
jgi:arylformamidase